MKTRSQETGDRRLQVASCRLQVARCTALQPSTFNLQLSTLNTRRSAFTLVEILTTLAIIALLAALVIPIIGVVNRTRVFNRTYTEMEMIATGIGSYKTSLGHYPPDVPGKPALNQLYYELLGTRITEEHPSWFTVLDGSAPRINAAQIANVFPGSSGFVNASRQNAGDEAQSARSFLSSLRPTQMAQTTVSGINVPVTILVGPAWNDPNTSAIPGTTINPWRYNSSNPTNNPGSYDLWIDLQVGGKTYRISNWSNKPIVL